MTITRFGSSKALPVGTDFIDYKSRSRLTRIENFLPNAHPLNPGSGSELYDKHFLTHSTLIGVSDAHVLAGKFNIFVLASWPAFAIPDNISTAMFGQTRRMTGFVGGR